MSETRSSLLAAGAVVVVIGAGLAGLLMRDKVDGAARLEASRLPLGALVASRDQRDVPEGDYFHELTELLKREYIDPVNDDMKLATGAVRGMVASLGDPNSMFMDKDEFRVHLKNLQGEYEGIGAALVLDLKGAPTPRPGQPMAADEAIASGLRIPRLAVAAVVPGGPADRAGVKPGDVVETVDGAWVVNAEPIIQFRALDKKVKDGKAKPEELTALRKELRAKMTKSILPVKAKDKLSIGTDGNVSVVWHRNGVPMKTEIARSTSKLPGFAVEETGIRLPLQKGNAEKLRSAIQGKTAVTIDLRNNPYGDWAEMKKILAVLAPSGDYGTLTAQGRPTWSLKVEQGNPKPPQLTLLVDKTTRGPAEILALALSSRSKAKLVGEQMPNQRLVVETVALPEGSGYTLATAEYKAVATPAAKEAKK